MFFQNVYKGGNEFWQYLITVLLVVAGYIVGQLPITIVAFGAFAQGENPTAQIQEFAETMDFSLLGIDSNLGLLLILLTFVFAMIGLWIGITKIHKRPLKTLITTFEKINWSKVFFGFGIWMLFSVVLEALSYFMNPDIYEFRFQLGSFLPLLAIALLLLPIQTSFEELFFRGYLMQAFGQIAANRWFPLLLTSVLFGVMHLANPEVAKFGTGLMMSYYIGIGLMLGIITLMDNSLELALGVHAATNIFGAVFVTFDGSALQTNAIFKTTEINIELMLPVTFVISLIFVFICSKRYNWSGWSEKLLGNINKPLPESVSIIDDSLES